MKVQNSGLLGKCANHLIERESTQVWRPATNHSQLQIRIAKNVPFSAILILGSQFSKIPLFLKKILWAFSGVRSWYGWVFSHFSLMKKDCRKEESVFGHFAAFLCSAGKEDRFIEGLMQITDFFLACFCKMARFCPVQ